MALLDVGKLWRFARAVEDLLRRDRAHDESFRAVGQRLDRIEERLTRLEAQQGIAVAEAKGAAAATGAANTVPTASATDGDPTAA